MLLAGLMFLGACAETQLLFHTAKRLSNETDNNKSKGNYKVGNPYKIKGVWYYPKVNYGYDTTGIASWYGPGFHGKKTANGQIYDQNALTAAHKTLPMPSMVEVTNLENGRSMRLTVNDRGPFAHGRIIDVSRRASQLLGFHAKGTARVRVRILAPESRVLARQAKGDTMIASTGSPIQSDTKLPKPVVAAESLEPPPGASTQRGGGDNGPVIRRSTSRGRLDTASVVPDGNVSQRSVSATRVYVQAGAYAQYDNAYQAAARLGILGNVKVTSKIVDGREFFRVRSGPVSSIEAADRVLERVLNNGFPDARIVID